MRICLTFLHLKMETIVFLNIHDHKSYQFHHIHQHVPFVTLINEIHSSMHIYDPLFIVFCVSNMKFTKCDKLHMRSTI